MKGRPRTGVSFHPSARAHRCRWRRPAPLRSDPLQRSSRVQALPGWPDVDVPLVAGHADGTGVPPRGRDRLTGALRVGGALRVRRAPRPPRHAAHEGGLHHARSLPTRPRSLRGARDTRGLVATLAAGGRCGRLPVGRPRCSCVCGPRCRGDRQGAGPPAAPQAAHGPRHCARRRAAPRAPASPRSPRDGSPVSTGCVTALAVSVGRGRIGAKRDTEVRHAKFRPPSVERAPRGRAQVPPRPQLRCGSHNGLFFSTSFRHA